ncbi:hypothetical protein CEY16_08980 [Halalkalibacillus sediminis]|uniref:Steroid 5-alpha reductase C-terminal domain-containing protein n=1 Tax=Halalkalibacillus sediminis TaxID=2018042 RepID=A0A2I0QVB7_9BACI|nr:hypothetical protein CEY16_08980 [Halalkalibacillus sediminis]
MTIFSVLLAAMILFMSIVWFIAIQIDDFSIVDIAWGLTFIVTAVTTLLLTTNYNATSLTILVLVLIWGVRLSGYLFYRNVGKPPKTIAIKICERNGIILTEPHFTACSCYKAHSLYFSAYRSLLGLRIVHLIL